MIRLLNFIMIALCVVLLIRAYWVWHLNQGGRKGRIPPKDRLTLFDVKELLRTGQKEMAVEVYSRIFNASRGESQKAVDELEKSMKE